MLIFKNAVLEYCVAPESGFVATDSIGPDGSCECWVDEDNKNIQSDYGDGHKTTASVSITINQSAVGDNFKPAFVRYKLNRSATFTEWLPVKNVQFFDLVKSIKILCL